MLPILWRLNASLCSWMFFRFQALAIFGTFLLVLNQSNIMASWSIGLDLCLLIVWINWEKNKYEKTEDDWLDEMRTCTHSHFKALASWRDQVTWPTCTALLTLCPTLWRRQREREHPCNLGYTNFGQLKKWFRTDGLEPTFAYIIRESWIYIQVKIIQFRQLVLELFMRGTRHSIRKSWPFIFARFPMSPIFKHFKTLFPKRIFKRNLASRR